ncbi:MAG: hypothetical protein J3R72DRAFT_461905 [Linnemannia gamsii]|nr:MAG: hypothetical protein J3R72DRAFT_461905 [Linnemannia gamsii]
MSTQAIQQTTEAAQEAAQETPLIIPTKARSALDSLKQFSLVQRYILTPAGFIRQRYVQSPLIVKVGLIGLGTMSAIPVGCFVGFMGMVTLGVLFVEGIALAVVEVSLFFVILFEQHLARFRS